MRKDLSISHGGVIQLVEVGRYRWPAAFHSCQLDAAGEKERIVVTQRTAGPRDGDEVRKRGVTGRVDVALVAQCAPQIEPRTARLGAGARVRRRALKQRWDIGRRTVGVVQLGPARFSVPSIQGTLSRRLTDRA